MLFHGALFDLALFETSGDVDTVIMINVSDALAVSLVEILDPIVPRLARSDSISIELTDSVAGMFGGVWADDDIGLSLLDDLGIFGDVIASDAIRVGLDDAVSPLVQLARSDAVSVVLSEGPASIASVMAVSEAIAVSIDEAISILAQLDLSDLICIAIYDAIKDAEKRLPPRTAVGGFGAGSVSGGIRAIRPHGSFGAGSTRGGFGR